MRNIGNQSTRRLDQTLTGLNERRNVEWSRKREQISKAAISIYVGFSLFDIGTCSDSVQLSLVCIVLIFNNKNQNFCVTQQNNNNK